MAASRWPRNLEFAACAVGVSRRTPRFARIRTGMPDPTRPGGRLLRPTLSLSSRASRAPGPSAPARSLACASLSGAAGEPRMAQDSARRGDAGAHAELPPEDLAQQSRGLEGKLACAWSGSLAQNGTVDPPVLLVHPFPPPADPLAILGAFESFEMEPQGPAPDCTGCNRGVACYGSGARSGLDSLDHMLAESKFPRSGQAQKRNRDSNQYANETNNEASWIGRPRRRAATARRNCRPLRPPPARRRPTARG